MAEYRDAEELQVIAPDSAELPRGDGDPAQLDKVPDPAGTPEPALTAAQAAPSDDTEEGTAKAVPSSGEAAAVPSSEDPLAWAFIAPDGK